jgi:alanine racemase
MSHFACADELPHPLNQLQLQRFQAATDGLPGPRSLANSAAVLNFPQAHADLIRPGIMLYGISPLPGKTGADHGLRPVMTLSCRLLAINDCRAGESVGYGATWQCPKDMRIGVAGIGYGDGYPRGVENGTPVLLNGRRAPLAGRVSMDLLTIDLRGHDDARVGDEVVLWGEGLPVEEIAAHCHAIPYELSCGVTRRVKRRNV